MYQKPDVRPPSFAEFLPAHGGGARDAWRDHYTFGGLPHVLALGDDAPPKRDDKGFVVMGITDFLPDQGSLDF